MELFDLRENVGAKVATIMEEKKITKVELCRKTGISRPTLDKMLSGKITNKTNYDKHLQKIMKELKVTTEFLVGNIEKNRTRTIRQLMSRSIDEISKATEISVERLKSIESGGQASIKEWRDIAVVLGTGVNILNNKNFFSSQISEMSLLLEKKGEDNSNGRISGFWGHVGILPVNAPKYKWYPITLDTAKFIQQDMNNQCMVIPCMDNKVLYLNTDNINRIVLLDEACSPPVDLDWSFKEGEGEIPLVVYESLEDYSMGKMQDMSPRFTDYIHAIIEDNKWDDDSVNSIINGITIYYTDGRVECDEIVFDEYENVSELVADTYEYSDYIIQDEMIYFTGYDERKNNIRLKNVAMIELPLIKTEHAICKECC